MPERPEWGEYAFGIALAVAARGDCSRRRVGAVVLDRNHRVAGCGYNGTYSGGPSCLAGECPRAFSDSEPGSAYDNCHASHAEINAIMDVDNRARFEGAVLYVTAEPCEYCVKHIRNTTRLRAILWREGGTEGIIALP